LQYLSYHEDKPTLNNCQIVKAYVAPTFLAVIYRTILRHDANLAVVPITSPLVSFKKGASMPLGMHWLPSQAHFRHLESNSGG
jgi:hypothetical protein